MANSQKPIYLDYASTTPVNPQVVEAMLPFYFDVFGNVSSTHTWGQKARQAVVDSRAKIAGYLNCSPSEIVFTSGGTESCNLAIRGVTEAVELLNQKGEKGHIVVSKIEHHAVLEPARELEEKGWEVSYVGVDEQGVVDIEDFRSELREDTIFVSVMYANNEVGSIQPIKELAEICRERGIVFHTDACQAVGFLELDVEELGVDLMTINAGKIYGPKGVGALYVRDGVDIAPQIVGGGQENEMRGGTENVAGIVGFARALELVRSEKEVEAKRLSGMRDKLGEMILEKIEGSVLNGPSVDSGKRLPNNLNISFEDVEGESLLLRLDMEGIAVSSGSACTSNDLEPSHVLKAMGVSDERTYSSLRLTFGKLVTEDDLPSILDRLSGVVRDLRGITAF